MESQLDMTLGPFERLMTFTGHQFSRSSSYARKVLGASLVEIHILDGDRLRQIATAGRATGQGGSAQALLPALRKARDVLIRPLETTGRRPGSAMTGAYLPLRQADGTLIGCYSVVLSARRGTFGAAERRTMRELAELCAMQIELAQMAALAPSDGSEGIASASPDGIVVADAHNTILAWNAGAERLFGYTAREAIGRSLDIIVPPGARSAHRNGLARVAGDGVPHLIGRSVDLPAMRKDGAEILIELSLSQWVEGGQRRFGAIMRDISERQRMEERLRNAAMVDHLTGLPNRSSLDRRLAELLDVKRHLTLLLIDLDGFKEVNDTLGHLAGDMVLAEVARRLRAHTRPGHFLARMSGDEFVVLMEDAANPMEGEWLGETLIDAIEEAITVDDAMVSISASIGIACAGGDETPEALIGDADLALYKAKRGGRGRTQLFTPDLRLRVVEKGLARAELATAWENKQFELYYQPQVTLRDGKLCGAEALLRWVHPVRGVLPPSAFLPLLETDALAIPVGGWIIDEACRQTAEWRASVFPGFRVAVNLFSLQFKSGDLVGEIERALKRHGLPPDALELEITENTILSSDERILKQLTRLRDLGVGLAFDDFGTGFASLSMLRHYPVTKIKIDRSFVSGADVCDKDRSITQALVHMAHGLDIEVIAEGIETMEHHALMRAQGCGMGQGYLYSRPVSARTFRALSCYGGAEQRAAG